MSALKRSAALAVALIARVPMAIKTLLLHGLRMSPVTDKQDLRTELTVAIIRSLLTIKHPILKTQENSLRDPGIKGPIWVSKVTLPRPEFDVRDAVSRAIDELKTGDETFDVPAVTAVEAEWTGHRSGVGKRTPQPDLSEEEKYRELRKETPSDMTILYLHGGAYILMDPCSHRVPVARLSRLTGAAVLSVRYRLAPQNPFPAALVDALTAYLSLIHPPPGALHEPIPANKIIIAGDSAGGNLSLVLLQTLLTLQRTSHSFRFHGKDVTAELPAGVATISPWCDITRSMPTIVSNAKFDYLGSPEQAPEDPADSTPFQPLPFPADEAWPTSPPRGDMYANADILLHPLVSPLAAPPELWKGAPPIFVSVGEEGLADEGLILARRVHAAGVPVVAEQFEGMPHCHGMVMLSTPASKRFFQGLAGFCRDAVAARLTPTGHVTYVGFKLRITREIPVDQICDVGDEEVEARLRRAREWRLATEKRLQKEWRAQAKL
ncbi:hypothetical protein N7492_008350 [Penicillium capsulatum]|uniref:Alpha/beta hydrolase fold-3 domain-containing protein n=1 Tax=Penicillium capsulatum TaxID=69766 RepID=A0A9W9LH01_9EURO|nr:hypothetical protein N7492_008350 [Penicillium capsulatum]KAJ6105753.1 hypothetical protein N7512_009270 [Penicillium capsulatum]